MAVIPMARRDPDPVLPASPRPAPRQVIDTRSGYEQLDDAVCRLEHLAEVLDRRLPPG